MNLSVCMYEGSEEIKMKKDWIGLKPISMNGEHPLAARNIWSISNGFSTQSSHIQCDCVCVCGGKFITTFFQLRVAKPEDKVVIYTKVKIYSNFNHKGRKCSLRRGLVNNKCQYVRVCIIGSYNIIEVTHDHALCSIFYGILGKCDK